MDTDRGHAARCGDQPAAGEHLPAPAGRADGGPRLPDGSLCGRLRGVVPEPCAGRGRLGGDHRLGDRQRLATDPDKSRLGDCRQPGEGFEFLGYRFEAGRRLVRKKSLDRLKDRIRAKTGRSRGDGLARIVVDLNRMLRGWFGNFKHAHPRTFVVLDKFIRQAAACTPAQAGEASRLRADLRRPSALAHRLLRGRRAARTPLGLARRETLPMRKPPTGEPYAGKLPVRFGGRGGAKPFPTPTQGT
jgi:hypothetical protein